MLLKATVKCKLKKILYQKKIILLCCDQAGQFSIIHERNDLSLHCTDFFLERRNRFDYLHCLEEVDLQMEVKMRLEVVSLQANHLQPHRDLHLEATTSRQWR